MCDIGIVLLSANSPCVTSMFSTALTQAFICGKHWLEHSCFLQAMYQLSGPWRDDLGVFFFKTEALKLLASF